MNALPNSRQAGARIVERARLDAAADLLWRYDPEQHHPLDYVLTIAEAISGERFRRRRDE